MKTWIRRLFDRRPVVRRRTRLGLEALDRRDLPAATAQLYAGTLFIRADPAVGSDVQVATRVIAPYTFLSVTDAGQTVGAFNPGQVGRVSFIGGAGNDTFAFADGTSLPLTADGGAGNDRITGGPAGDTLRGGDGHDTLQGSAGADQLEGGVGNDTYLFAADAPLGTDTVVEAAGAGSDTLDLSPTTAAVRAELTDGPYSSLAVNANLQLAVSGEVENVTGGAGNDRLGGNALDNRLTGGPGDDTYVFDADGPAGTDTVVEGAAAGADTFDFTPTAAGVRVNLTPTSYNAQSVAPNLRLAIFGDVEHAVGGSGNDALIGTAVHNRLEGGPGNDTLSGAAGDDTLLGGDGNDLMYDYVGANVIDGGAGQDGIAFDGTAGNDRIRVGWQKPGDVPQVVFELNGQVIVMDYKNGETIFVHAGDGNDEVVMDGDAGLRWRAEFFGERGHDHLVGNAQADRLDGGAGHDWLEGGAGDDDLIGGAGHDLFDGGAGADRIAAGDAEVDLIFVDDFDRIDTRDRFDVIWRRR